MRTRKNVFGGFKDDAFYHHSMKPVAAISPTQKLYYVTTYG